MPPTSDDFCDWCYGPLAEADLRSPLGRALGGAEAGACANCVAARSVLSPPDSLEPTDNVSVPGDQVWALAVGALLGDDSLETQAAQALRQVAGYE